MKTIFITATGTNVGKTVISSALAHGLIKLGYKTAYWKPVQSGQSPTDSETFMQLTEMAKPHNVAASNHDCGITIFENLFQFPSPLSPDQAAIQDQLPAAELAEISRQLDHYRTTAEHDFLLVEGAGGLLVPLNHQNETWLDFLRSSDLPALVVCSSELGTINHTSLTLKTLDYCNRTVIASIINGHLKPLNETSLNRMWPDTKFLTFEHLRKLNENEHWGHNCTKLAQGVLEACETPGHSKHGKEACNDTLQSEGLETAATLRDYDRRNVWHPYTQHQDAPEPIMIDKAEGVWLTTQSGQKLLDGTSSWWVNTIGHGRQEIHRAIARQQAKLDHSIFAGATHAPGAQLANSLVKLTNKQLQRVFYSDNGSTAVEVALKIAFQFWSNQKKPRSHFLALKGGYHGDTIGTMSVAADSEFHVHFKPLMYKNFFIEPATNHPSYLCPNGRSDLETRKQQLAQLLDQHHKKIAAVLVEPLIMGAGGMLVQEVEWLRYLDQLCKHYDVLLILDEVFSGMGRCGAPFAFQRADIKPDLICLAKGLTGGTIPLAVTMASEKLFQAFCLDDKHAALMHGHSFTGNPIACSVAMATLDIYKRDALFERANSLEHQFQYWINTHAEALELAYPRALGGILAFELPGSSFGDYYHPQRHLVSRLAQKHGLLLRPLGNTLYLVPPLSISDEETDYALTGIRSVLIDLKKLSDRKEL